MSRMKREETWKQVVMSMLCVGVCSSCKHCAFFLPFSFCRQNWKTAVCLVEENVLKNLIWVWVFLFFVLSCNSFGLSIERLTHRRPLVIKIFVVKSLSFCLRPQNHLYHHHHHLPKRLSWPRGFLLCSRLVNFFLCYNSLIIIKKELSQVILPQTAGC